MPNTEKVAAVAEITEHFSSVVRRRASPSTAA